MTYFQISVAVDERNRLVTRTCLSIARGVTRSHWDQLLHESLVYEAGHTRRRN